MAVVTMNHSGPTQPLESAASVAAPVLVVGLGKTGIACARHLRDRYGVALAAVDSRATPPGLAEFKAEFTNVPVHTGGFDVESFERASTVVLSPGVALDEPAIERALERGVPVIGEIELFARAAVAPIAAITGSNGKSTVTSLLGAMAAKAGRNAAVGGNLGTPALELLPSKSSDEPDAYVIELSSFQLETTFSLNAAVATVLNLSPDHLDRHGTMAAYAAAKARIYKGDGVTVINLDDPGVVAMRESGRDAIGFSATPRAQDAVIDDFSGPVYGLVDGPVEGAGGSWLARWSNGRCTPLIAQSALPTPGRHNAANALAALALGSVLDLDERSMLATLREYTGLPHRCQLIAEAGGVRWYNDSKGTNVGATKAALEGIGEQSRQSRVVLIAGGDGKGADFTPLSAPLAVYASVAILFGRDADTIENDLAGSVPIRRAANLPDAVRLAHAAAEPGDSVLFSPACASFDMFENFITRGIAFVRCVNEELARSRTAGVDAGHRSGR